MEQHAFTQIEDHVMSIVLNRPDSLNAISPEMIEVLQEAITQAETDDTIHVVTISGAGRAFCSGADVKTFHDTNFYQRLESFNKLLLQIRALEKPVISVVHGYVVGGGFNMALSTDIIFAADHSKFLLPFTQLGLISDAGSIGFLTPLIGPFRTKELLFNGGVLDVNTAKDWGIVNRIYPAEELQEQAMQYARQLAQGPRMVYGKTKGIVHRAQTSTLEEILELEKLTQLMLIETEDHKEGIQAFVEKRKPVFKGK